MNCRMSRQGVNNEDQVKRLQDGVQKTSSFRRGKPDDSWRESKSSSNSQEGVGVKSRSASGNIDEKVVPRVALREMDRLLGTSSRRSTPKASSVNSKREAKGQVGYLSATRKGEKGNLSRGSSPLAHVSQPKARNKSSPQPLQIYRDEVLKAALPIQATHSCGPGKGSPSPAGFSRIRHGGKVGEKSSMEHHQKTAKPSSAATVMNCIKSCVSPAVAESKQPEILCSIQSSLHRRLSMLEGRVSRMATELREAKELLDANNSICSKELLTSIESKVTNIERCMMTSREGGRAHSPTSVSLRERILSEQESFKRALQSSIIEQYQTNVVQADCVPQQTLRRRSADDYPTLETKLRVQSDKQPRVSRLGNPTISFVSKMQDCNALDLAGDGHDLGLQATAVFEGISHYESQLQLNDLAKNRPSLHQKLVENRVALHEKLKQNRELLRSNLADLGAQDKHILDACNEGTLVDDDGRTDGEKELEHVNGYLEDRNVSTTSGGLAGGRVLGVTPVDSYHTRNFEQDTTSYYSVKETRSHGVEVSTLISSGSSMVQVSSENTSSNGSIFSSRKHRYSDAMSSSPSSEQSSPLHSWTGPTAREDKENQCLNSSLDGEFVEIDHLRVTDESRISKKAGSRMQPTKIRPAADVFSSDTFSFSNLRCDETLLLDDEKEEDHSIQSSSTQRLADGGEEETVSEIIGERLLQIGEKTTTAGWFTCEGEGILLAHEDGCCSYHDVANMEEKAEYKAPIDFASGIWGDCWIVRAAGVDGCSSKYVVAASAGGAVDSAFCSWDYYDQSIAACHRESPLLPILPQRLSTSSGASKPVEPSSLHMGPSLGLKKWFDRSSTFNLSRSGENTVIKKTFKRSMSLDNTSICGLDFVDVGSKSRDSPLWWYRPCGALLASAASGLRTISLYDIRDGDVMLHWDTKTSVTAMDYSSPLQWRSEGKLVMAEEEYLSFWDVHGLEARCLHYVNLVGQQMRALHVYNVDAESSGGVRQRLSSSDHHSDGILCTNDAVNVLDFRIPTGIAKKFPSVGEETHSLFANGDAVFAGATSVKTRLHADGTTKLLYTQCKVNQWSIRQGKPMNVYTLPASSSHSSYHPITQVWGSTDTIMAANEKGLFLFDAARHSSGQETANVGDVIGSDDLDNPSFDLASSCVLLVSKDRPALCCHWP